GGTFLLPTFSTRTKIWTRAAIISASRMMPVTSQTRLRSDLGRGPVASFMPSDATAWRLAGTPSKYSTARIWPPDRWGRFYALCGQNRHRNGSHGEASGSVGARGCYRPGVLVNWPGHCVYDKGLHGNERQHLHVRALAR